MASTGPVAPPRLVRVEILQIDTVRSRDLLRQLNGHEKLNAQKIFRDLVDNACQPYMYFHWAGDGGFVLFESVNGAQLGRSAKAAETILDGLPECNAQTGTYLESKFERTIRVCAHRCEIAMSADNTDFSGLACQFDDFVKGEKKFAPSANTLYVTTSLYENLPVAAKNRFDLHQSAVMAGQLRTSLYRLKRSPPDSVAPLADDESNGTPTPNEWKHARNLFRRQVLGTNARNFIAKRLILLHDTWVEVGKSGRSSEWLMKFSLESLGIHYFPEAYPDRHIRISYWRPTVRAGQTYLLKSAVCDPRSRPIANKQREICTSATEYKVALAFQRRETVITPSVPAARNRGDWIDFSADQRRPARTLLSAMEMPVYWENSIGDKSAIGVLSLESDADDTFVPTQASIWREELSGFLVNIALAESLRRIEERRLKQNGGE